MAKLIDRCAACFLIRKTVYSFTHENEKSVTCGITVDLLE